MRCPYCSSPAVENQEECPRCGFALHKLEGWFGAIPQLSSGLADNAALFTQEERKRLENEIARFRKAFPQLLFHLVTVDLNPGDNLSLYTFWIFNRSGICNDMARGDENRSILMIVDALNTRVCLTMGYGLEPFLGEHHIAAAGTAAAADLRAGRCFEGVRATIGALTNTLTEVHGRLDETYGIDAAAVVAEERPDRVSEHAVAGSESEPY